MSADSNSAGILVLCWLLSWGATYFVHSTCLIVGIWLFVRNRQSAGHALRETLWKTALVGGVVTASIQLWLSPFRPFGDLTLRIEGIGLPVAAAKVSPTASAASINPLDAWDRYEREAVHGLADEMTPVDSNHEYWIASLDANSEIAGKATGPDGAHKVTSQSSAGRDNRSAQTQLIGTMAGARPATPALATAVALLAIVVGIARCGWQTISLRRKLARCRLIRGGPARHLLDELLRSAPRAPEVRLLSAPDDSEPAAFGIARWTIVLPPRAAFDLTEDELRALLAHELAHLVRGDSIWLCISRVLCSCLAFQPLNHLARREWQRTAEFLCDNWAVNRTGAPLALARCLTEVASWRLAGSASPAILAATGRKSGLIDRVERLLDARPVCESRNELRDRRRTAFAGALVLAFLAYFAPRVQLVAAGKSALEQPGHELPRHSQVEATAREQVSGDAYDPDEAKSPASGERQSREAEYEAEPGEAPSVNAAQRPAGDSKSLLESLDDDLMALQSELESLGPLLNENVSPQAAALARQLRGEIVRLQHRREVLKASWRKSMKRF